MKLAKNFRLNLSGAAVQISALIAFCAYEIMQATDANGQRYDVSLHDLEVFESFVESRITSTTLPAIDQDTYETVSFTVHAYGSDILAIVHESGHTVERNSPTWSEVAESWDLDRQYAEALDSDAPQVAAAAGFLRPVPIPSQQGFGYRRAA